MRQHRASLLVVAAALTPALLFTTPAFAAGSTAAPAATSTVAAATFDKPVDEMSEDELRAAIAAILVDEKSGKGVVREANEALNGTVDDMRAFLKTGYRLAQAEDDRVAILTILNGAQKNGDKRVIAEINGLLDRDSPEEMRAWLETGYRLAQAEDDRVAIFTLLNGAQKNGDKRVISEINGLLDRNSPEEMRAWLTTGYRLAQAEDDRVAIVTILAGAQKNGDKALIAEINGLLDRDSPEEMRAWLVAFRSA
ncbi:ALF repeat-containing protein [Streptomyces sp. NPDC059913]|uniref:ALF repeat-containing protein n=1 Tax=unclassified Streptomyces TaxID=2593676 RepID=UPI003659303F